MSNRFTLADKINSTVVAIGLFCVILVYYISSTYKELAYEHHTQSIQQLASLEIEDLISELKADSLDLALSIEHENKFKDAFQQKDTDELIKQLDNQFYQYFVTAGVIKLLKLYVLDTDFTLLSTSTEGIETERDSKLICPELSRAAFARQGSEKLQTLSRICSYKNIPAFAVIVPFGGLSPKGYIQVIADLGHKLQEVERSLARPIKINTLPEKNIYQSKKWLTAAKDYNYLNVNLPILGDDNTQVMNITLKSDMTLFNKEISQHRNWIMALTLVTTALAVFTILFLLRRSTIQPLAKIHHILENIHSQPSANNKTNRLLFSQLLEQMIQLRKKSKMNFAVMVIDLTHFKQVNIEFGEKVGDILLNEVEKRLSSALRDTDLISWVGTDSPGHKLLPADTKTQYRATIARLGGDEFGLLLPSAHTDKQALAVAKRIIKTLSNAFAINEHTITIDCKIGISLYPRDGSDEKQLIRNADTAMYDAKKHNQTVFIFNPATKKTQIN
jgi:GGDEF domain-containing protein